MILDEIVVTPGPGSVWLGWPRRRSSVFVHFGGNACVCGRGSLLLVVCDRLIRPSLVLRIVT